MSIYEVQEKLGLIHNELERHRRETAHLETERANALAEFRCALARGETTGDRLADTVIGIHGINSPMLEAYRSIEHAIKGKAGELVLFKFSCNVRTRHVLGRGWETEPRQCFRLGILDSDQLIVGEGQHRGGNAIDFSINRFIDGSRSSGTAIGQKTSRFKVYRHSLFDTYHDPSPDFLAAVLKEPSWKQRFSFGDAEVRKQLRTVLPFQDSFDDVAEALGRLILKSSD